MISSLLADTPEVLPFHRFVPAVAVLVLLLTWESLRPLHPGRTGRWRHGLKNLAVSAINSALLFATLGLLTALIVQWTADNRVGLLHVIDVGAVGRLALGFVVLDVWTYFWHRANHRAPFLWRFHRMHHSDAGMDCTTAARFHVGELAMSALLRFPLIVAMGLDLTTIVVYETVLLAVTQFHHADVNLGEWDRGLRWLIVTPAMHQVHHSRRAAETNSNYASVLSVWDRVGESFRRPETVEPIELGLAEFADPKWHTLAGMLRTPLASDPKAEARP